MVCLRTLREGDLLGKGIFRTKGHTRDVAEIEESYLGALLRRLCVVWIIEIGRKSRETDLLDSSRCRLVTISS